MSELEATNNIISGEESIFICPTCDKLLRDPHL